MEDHNTATFPSKKYYNLDAYYKRQMEKEMKKGRTTVESERTVFNDEEQRRLELRREREKVKEAEVEALKQSMQSGMAQAMKEKRSLEKKWHTSTSLAILRLLLLSKEGWTRMLLCEIGAFMWGLLKLFRVHISWTWIFCL